MNKTKRTGAVALALVMVLALVPMVTPNAQAATVVINLAGLEAALNSGGEAVLSANISGTTQLSVKNNSTIDLNGHNLIVKASNATNAIVIEPGITLTIKDSKYTGNKIDNGRLEAWGRVGIHNTSATLIIDSGFVTATGNSFGAAIGGDQRTSTIDGGTVIINGGTVTATANGLGAAIGGGRGQVHPNPGGNGGNVRITGGTVKATGGSSGYDIGSGRSNNSNGGTLEVTGGTLEFANSGTNASPLSFKNCTIKGKGAEGFSGKYNAQGKRNLAEFSNTKKTAGQGKTLKLTVKGESIKAVKWTTSKKANVKITKGANKKTVTLKGVKKGKKSTIKAVVTYKDGSKKTLKRIVTVK